MKANAHLHSRRVGNKKRKRKQEEEERIGYIETLGHQSIRIIGGWLEIKLESNFPNPFAHFCLHHTFVGYTCRQNSYGYVC